MSTENLKRVFTKLFCGAERQFIFNDDGGDEIHLDPLNYGYLDVVTEEGNIIKDRIISIICGKYDDKPYLIECSTWERICGWDEVHEIRLSQ